MSVRIICRVSRKEVIMYNTKRAANCLQKVVILLSLKEGTLTCTKIVPGFRQPTYAFA